MTELESSHYHSRYPEENDVRTGDEIIGWVKFAQIGGIIRPA